MAEELIKYEIDSNVEAFSTTKGAVLPYDIILGDQVHDIRTTVIKSPFPDPEILRGTDALITNLKRVAIGVRTADCIPILLYDPQKQVIAAIHAGWKGTLRRIVNSAISQMRVEYGSVPKNLKAVIGPGIQKNSFQVGEEVAFCFKDLGFPVEKVYSWNGPKIRGNATTGHHIDLVAANIWLLQSDGVDIANIQVSKLDTFTEPFLYSARREGIDCGRMVTSIKLL